MAWNDDENTDPGAVRPDFGQQRPGQRHPQHAPPQQGYQQPQNAPQQPYPTGHQQAVNPQHGAQRPQTGGYPNTAIPGDQGQRPSTAGYPHATGPSPAVQGHPQNPYPQQPNPTTDVPLLQAPVVAIEEEAKASRVVYGLSGTAAGGIAGVLLGVLNTTLEGQTVTEGSDFIMNCAIWGAFAVGFLAYLVPERFAYGLMRLTGGADKDEE